MRYNMLGIATKGVSGQMIVQSKRVAGIGAFGQGHLPMIVTMGFWTMLTKF